MKEIKINRDKLKIENGKVKKEDLLNCIEDEFYEFEVDELENSNNLYLVLKDK